MCKRATPKAGHLLFISPLSKRAVGHFHWAKIGGTGCYQVTTERSTPCVRCSRVGHMSFFESHMSNSNGHLRAIGHDQVSTGRVWYSPVSCAESSANCDLTGLRAPDGLVLTGLMRREGCKTPSHRTHTTRRTQSVRGSQSDSLCLSQATPDAWAGNTLCLVSCIRCSTLTGPSTDSTADAQASVRCLRALRPAPVTSPNFPSAQ